MKFFSYITVLFSNKRCCVCHETWHFFCPKCDKNIEKRKPFCFICKEKSTHFDICSTCLKHSPLSQVIVLSKYNTWSMKKALHHAKYYKNFRIYEDIIDNNSDFFRQHIDENGILVPIPMHFLRSWRRWYNHSQKIAESLSKTLWMHCMNSLLKKSRYTKQQSKLNRQNRKENLKNSFKLKKCNLNPKKTIYLVDDVVSTWSTLTEAAELLKKHGFTDVRAIVLSSN